MKFLRKIQKHGGSYTIGLPREWIRIHDLNSGDELEIEDVKDALVIKKVKK